MARIRHVMAGFKEQPLIRHAPPRCHDRIRDPLDFELWSRETGQLPAGAIINGERLQNVPMIFLLSWSHARMAGQN